MTSDITSDARPFMRARDLLKDPAAWAWIVSVLAGMSFWWIAPFIYTNDTPGYIEGARSLVGLSGGNYSYWRTPGFPVFVLMTGVASGITLHVLVLLQLLMGILVPIAIYYSISWVSRWLALLASILCSLSLVPYQNVTYVMPNQLFTFSVVVSTVVACRYLATRNFKLLYLLSLACFAMVIARPQGSLLFVAFLAALVPFNRREFMHWIAALGLVLGLQFLYTATRPLFAKPIALNPVVLIPYGEGSDMIPGDDTLYRRAMVMLRENLFSNALFFGILFKDDSKRAHLLLAVVTQHLLNGDLPSARKLALSIADPALRDRALQVIAAGRWSVPTTAAPAVERAAPKRYVEGFDLTNTSSKMLFFQIYAARGRFPHATVSAANGQATAQLTTLMEAYISNYPDQFVNYQEISSRTPREAANYMLSGRLSTNHLYEFHWGIWMMMDAVLGPSRADGLFKQVYLEFVAEYPMEVATIYLHNMMAGLTLQNLFQFRENAPGFLPTHPRIQSTSARFDREIARSEHHAPTYLKLNQFYVDYYPPVFWLLLGVAVIGLFIAIAIGAWIELRLLVMAWLVALHQIAVCAVTAGVGFNYTSISCIYITIAAAIGIHAIYQKWIAPERGGSARSIAEQ